MKKTLFLFSILTVLMLFQGCFMGYRSSLIVSDYDERCWYGDHWVYRFYEGNHWTYRYWQNSRWENERSPSAVFETQKWVKKSHNDRDDGRKYDNENDSRDNNGENSREGRKDNGQGGRERNSNRK